jgi:hypothetical protein
MSIESGAESDDQANEAWWRAQALALAVELSSVRGQYQAQLDQLRRESSEAIEWLEGRLSSETPGARGLAGRMRRWLRTLRSR